MILRRWKLKRLFLALLLGLLLIGVLHTFAPSPEKSAEVRRKTKPDGGRVEEGVEERVEERGDGEKKDWTDRKLQEREEGQTGPGEHGLPYRVPKGNPELADTKQKLYRVNGFNALASDSIALNRSVKDIRHKGCLSKRYLTKLPRVSVILPFHNEHLTTLLRSVHSIINRSPTELLEEVILADDFSDKEFLKSELDAYVKREWRGKVRIVRAEKREGLIRARLMGARVAKAEVLLFLDSHSECNTNWLPPLLEPIAQNYRTAVCPFVDVIDYETFEYRAQDEGARGAFDWELYYKRLPLLPADRNRPTEPFQDPVMAGGYFAISAKWFWELGGYDDGLDIWGGEQYELSFKIWQCGGELLDAPCSRVGHIYRKFAPFGNPGVGDFIGRNYKRVAEVWMDEYAEFIYKRRPRYRKIDPGDMTKQKALREKLQCKSFKWFMENIAWDLPKKYPPIEPPDGAEGELRNVGADLCVDTRFKRQNERFGLKPCISDDSSNGGEQYMILSHRKDLGPRKRNVCFDVSSSNDGSPVVLFTCHAMQGNQHFVYRLSTHQLYHPVSGLCLDCDPAREEILMRNCQSHSDTQQWKFTKINETVIRSWDK